jgi:hypothetical protein
MDWNNSEETPAVGRRGLLRQRGNRMKLAGVGLAFMSI